MEISVLVPVYNNAATLEELLDRLVSVLDQLDRPFEIIMVDDGSKDDSLAILQRRAAADARIRPFALARNYGSQAASAAACDQVRGQRVVHIDADLENFPEDIPRLLQHMDAGYDFVCGYRDKRQGPWLTRRLPSWLMNVYVRRQTGTSIRDVGCGLRALDARLIRDLASEGEGRRLLTPVILRRARRIIQVPVRHRAKDDRGGHSFVSLLGIAADYYMLTAWRPFLVTGFISVTALVVGVAVLLFGGTLSGVFLVSGGAVGALGSLVGEYAQRMYHLMQGVPFYQLRDLDKKSE